MRRRPSEGYLRFPGSPAGKESTCNSGDLGLILGLGRSTGEEIGYTFQYSWASLAAQLVKSPPAMQETWYNPWVGKIPWRRAWQPTLVFCPGEFHGLFHGVKRVGHDWSTFIFTFQALLSTFLVPEHCAKLLGTQQWLRPSPQEIDNFDKQSENFICVVRGMVPSACESNGSKQKSSLFALSAHCPFQQENVLSYQVKGKVNFIHTIH